MAAPRAQWGSRLGFILAAAGSAVGLGNLWKFPYVMGENGGGVFVLAYLVCVLVVGLPVMAGEIIVGRATQKSPLNAVRELADDSAVWKFFALLWAFAAVSLLSFYSVIAGWALHYAFISLTGQLSSMASGDLQGVFSDLSTDGPLQLFWHIAFMALTMGVVLGGVQKGIDRWSRVLMPALLIMLLGLVLRAAFLPGFGEGLEFALGVRPEEFKPESALAALGQAFFSLSIGMGTMMTYGSYLKRDDDIMSSAIQISALDTAVALLGSLVVFPIIFTFAELSPGQGPGLLFASIPTGLIQMPAAWALLSIFFVLLVFAALTSAISLLEVPVSILIDTLGWGRKRASFVAGLAVTAYGVPSALSGDFLGGLDGIVSNIMFPLGGIGVALFVGWRMQNAIRHDHFLSGSKYAFFYGAWLFLLRFVVPVGISIVFYNAVSQYF